MNYGFVIDNRKCIGCHACTVACKSEHDIPIGVNRTHVKYVEKGVFPNTRRTFTVTRCNHCETAPCAEICPTSALFTRSDGIVDFDSDRCIACKSCMQACPYDALYIDPATQTAAKCNYCGHRVDNGFEPACVIVCPVEAIISGDLDDPEAKISRLISREQTSLRKPEKNTSPNVFYIDGDHQALDPLATEPSDAYLFMDQAHGVGHFARYAEDRLSRAASEDIFVPGQEDSDGGGVLLAGAISVSQRAIDDVTREIQEERRGTEARRVYDTPDKGVLWGWQVPAYIWTKAVATGTFMVLILAGLLGDQPSVGDSLAALLTAIVFLGATAGLLVYDLDRPERFLYVLLRPNWQSWLVRGAYGISVFGLLVSLMLLALVQGWGTLYRWLMWPSFGFALLGSTYTAFLFAQAKGRDLWQSPTSAFRMLNQAMLCGCVVLIWIQDGFYAPLRPLLIGGLLLNLALLLAEVWTPHGTRDAARAAKMMTSGIHGLYFLSGLVLGTIFPMIVLLVGAPYLLVLFCGVMIMGGIYLTEYVWVRVPQLIPLA